MKREKLFINPATWLHREGGAKSFLLRASDGKQCCLGIYLQDNCGVNPDVLLGVSSPDLLPDGLAGTLPDWLAREPIGHLNSDLVGELMDENDRVDSSEASVRKGITRLFAQADIEVEFVSEVRNVRTKKENSRP